MKSLKFITLLLVTLLSCSNEKSINDPKQDSIIGQWQLIAQKYGTTNSEGSFVDVENGYIMSFINDSSFQSNQWTACENELNQGIFSLSEIDSSGTISQIVSITIDCNVDSSGVFVREFYYLFENSYLILLPKNPVCPEGCSFRFKKITSE